jgi:osmoprotectant transport system substrate-binding protein
MKKATVLLMAAVLALGVAACGGNDLKSDTGGSSSSTPTGGSAGGGAKRAITVGSANFPENVVLAEIYAGALGAKGFKVDKKLNVGSREAIFPAMQNGDIGVLPEYTGALLSYVSKGKATAKDTAGQVTELKGSLPAGLTLLEPSTAEDKDTVTCTKEVVGKYNLKSLDDLAKVGDQVTMGGPPELAKREGFGIKGLERVYGITFKQFRPLDVAGPLTVSALKSGKVDCANLFSTQSAIPQNGFITLEDPKGLVESEAVVPLITKDAATADATQVLNAVSSKLTTENLKEMVKRVEVDKDDAATVAGDFLGQNALK